MRFGQGEKSGSGHAQVSRAWRALSWVGTLLPTVVLCGCSGIVNGQNSGPPPPPPQTYSISGIISPAAGGNGATVTLSGATNATTTANSSGDFTVTGLANGTYTITPSHAGFRFTPGSLQVTINGANVTTGLNFTATALSFGISGTITPTAGGSGATVTLSGAVSATTTANSSGNYSFTGLANGLYAVTPSLTGYTFSPGVQSTTINGGDVTGLNFTAIPQTAPTFSISGMISPTLGGAGATVILGGAAGATTVTNSAGNYTFTGLAKGSYTVTPSSTGYVITPASQNVTVNAANVTGVNFTATVPLAHSVALTWNASTSVVTGYNVYRSTVSGSQYIKVNSSPVSVLAYTDTTVVSGSNITYYYVTTAVNSSGLESIYSTQTSATVP
jgi:Carboxypeptidase regulatory-like domain